jgi:hypothetical protein
MSDGKQTRLQFTKAEKRAMAGETTRFAAADQRKRKAARDAKTRRRKDCGPAARKAIARPQRVGDGLEGKDALRLARCPGRVPNCLSRQP